MDLLLDTHVFLWWDSGDARLDVSVHAAIANPANQVFVSAASVWEIAIKAKLGKLSFAGSPTAAIDSNGFRALPILPIEAELAGNFTWAHADPFDRLLVAQATQRSLTLVTADAAIHDHATVALLKADRQASK